MFFNKNPDPNSPPRERAHKRDTARKTSPLGHKKANRGWRVPPVWLCKEVPAEKRGRNCRSPRQWLNCSACVHCGMRNGNKGTPSARNYPTPHSVVCLLTQTGGSAGTPHRFVFSPKKTYTIYWTVCIVSVPASRSNCMTTSSWIVDARVWRSLCILIIFSLGCVWRIFCCNISRNSKMRRNYQVLHSGKKSSLFFQV